MKCKNTNHRFHKPETREILLKLKVLQFGNILLVSLRLIFQAHLLDKNSCIKPFLFPTFPIKTVCCQLCITFSFFLLCFLFGFFLSKQTPHTKNLQSKRAHTYTSNWDTEIEGEMSQQQMDHRPHLPASTNPAIITSLQTQNNNCYQHLFRRSYKISKW